MGISSTGSNKRRHMEDEIAECCEGRQSNGLPSQGPRPVVAGATTRADLAQSYAHSACRKSSPKGASIPLRNCPNVWDCHGSPIPTIAPTSGRDSRGYVERHRDNTPRLHPRQNSRSHRQSAGCPIHPETDRNHILATIHRSLENTNRS